MKLTQKNKSHIAIMGGGAAGMASAIAAAEIRDGGNCEIVLFEARERLGKKLLATGNGRCNFGNLDTDICRYHGEDPGFVQGAFRTFDVQSNIVFFRRLGILTRVEDGRLYPYSNQAAAVLDALRLEIDRLAIDLHCGCKVLCAQKQGNGFLLQTEAGAYFADKLIVAAGGIAAPDLGGSKNGYQILESLGHRSTPLFPSLVQIKIDHPLPKALRGIKCKGQATLCRNKTQIAREEGEILFTEYGLSGPPILQLSRKVGENPAPGIDIALDFFPEFPEEKVKALLTERQRDLGHLTLENFLIGLINKKIGQLLIKYTLNQSLSRKAETLTEAECSAIAGALKRFSLPIAGTLSWKNSQVTAGGIATVDFDPQTMESLQLPGLYAVGEVLDIDGDCGGFNLQWAWSSGRAAGRAAMTALKKEEEL